jgi:hypothetical protein
MPWISPRRINSQLDRNLADTIIFLLGNFSGSATFTSHFPIYRLFIISTGIFFSGLIDDVRIYNRAVKTKVVYETRKGSWAGSLRELLALLYFQKNHIIDTFLFIRILNPMLVKIFQEISVFSQKIDIYSDSV